MPPEATYRLHDDATEATFHVERGSDRTNYGTPHLIQTNRLNVGRTNTVRLGGTSPDIRNLTVRLLSSTRGSKASAIEVLYKTDSSKTLVFPSTDAIAADLATAATANGQYMFTGLSKTHGAATIDLTLELTATTSTAAVSRLA